MDLTKTINTPYNNAVAIFNETNRLLLENNILDSTGTEIAQLESTPSNPAWLFALACGSLHTSWQEQLSKAYAALDPQSCEEDQVLVLASIAGVERGNGKPSHVTLYLENTTNVQVTIPARTKFTETYTNHAWYNDFPITLSPVSLSGWTGRIAVYAEVDGALSVPIGTSFQSEDFPGVTAVTDAACFVGNDIETIASLRNRISEGVETTDYMTQCVNAIERLPGIDACSIWYNTSNQDPMVLGTGANEVSVPPRNAYIAIKGTDISEKIAQTYFTYMNSPATAGTADKMTSVCQIGQQPLTVCYDVAKPKHIAITVYIDWATSAVGVVDAIKERVSSYSGTLTCGENLTAQQVSEWLTDLGYGTIIGVEIDGGMSSDIDPMEYCVFENNQNYNDISVPSES